MPYIINKTNGQQIAIVQDASLDQTTDLIFVGRNYAGYGEIQNENFLKLLENFSNVTPPANPIVGQTWYNNINNTLNVCYAEASGTIAAKFKTLAVSNIGSAAPTDAVIGDLWYDSVSGQLNVWNGSEYIVVGPDTGTNIKAQWRGDFEYNVLAPDLPVFNIKAILGTGDEVIAILSAETYDMSPDYSISPTYPSRTNNFTKISKGITLQGADPITGSSRSEVTGLSTSSYFWGTAAESLNALHADVATAASGLTAGTTGTNSQFYVTFINSTTNTAYIDGGITYNPSTNVLTTIASSALYADLAERYEADSIYDEGTVMVIGGTKEITISTEHASTAVAGVVSKNPAYLMNSEAGTDETHPAIALKGRVPCKIYGPVRKGELLVSSSQRPGYATARQLGDDPNAVIGKALEDFKGLSGVIEIKV
jgi:hypothetical protein